MFRVTLANAAGAPVIVTPRDVSVLLSRRGAGGDGEVGTAAVTVAPTGELTVAYTVTGADVAELSMAVIVRGVSVWTGVAARRVADPITGRHTRTLAITAGAKYGLVVTPDARFLAVSHYNEHKLRVYRVEADGTATLLHTVGTKGSGPNQFNNPFKMCLTPAGNLLICEYSNNRVQELTGPGEAEPQHVRFIPVGGAFTIALYGDTLAVGTTRGTIQLLGYTSGALIRSIGSSGSGRGQISGDCDGLRFTPDGQFIVVAERKNNRLSMFAVSDCGFVKHIGAGVVANFEKDVQFAPNGEMFVADYENHRVCVFSADGDTLLRTWGTNGTADGQFQAPTALALVNSKLFVLDQGSARVQVFE